MLFGVPASCALRVLIANRIESGVIFCRGQPSELHTPPPASSVHLVNDWPKVAKLKRAFPQLWKA